MFTRLFVLANAVVFINCQICVLDDRLHVLSELDGEAQTPRRSWLSLISYFAFNCPNGFQEYGVFCVYRDSSQPDCPELESLNLEYNISTCSTKLRDTSDNSTDRCAYPISQFLSSETERNSVKLELSIGYQCLYLDVSAEKALSNMQEHIICWESSIRNRRKYDGVRSIEFEPTFPMRSGEEVTSIRYTLPIQNPYSTYLCMFLNPGKQKAVVSNKINMLKQRRSNYTFLDLGKVCTCVDDICYIGHQYFGCEIVDGVRLISMPKDKYINFVQAINSLKDIVAEHLNDLERSESSEEILDEYVVSNQYCPEDGEPDGVLWCTTSIGRTTTPCKNPCLDVAGKLITRKCEGDFLTGARWAQPSAICSENTTLPERTKFLLNKRNRFVTRDTLFNITSVIRQSPNITAIDLDSVTTVLSNAVNQNNSETLHDAYFDAIDNVLSVNEYVFSNTFNSRRNILNSVDQFVKKTCKSPANFTLRNLALKVYRPYSSLTDSFDQMLRLEHTSAKFPMRILRELSLNKSNFTVAMTIFKNRKLFSEGLLASDIADIIIPDANISFTEPISIFLEQNTSYAEVVCAYWEFGADSPGNWSTIGVKTLRTNDTNIIECQTYHLTSFVLLGISERVLGEINTPVHKAILKYISTLGCLLSLFGTSITIYTAFAYAKWYKRRINSLQLCCIVFLEVFMLFVADIFELYGDSCIAVGAIMHYLVLVKFLIMLMIAKQQYSNFVSVLQSRNMPQYKLINTAVITIVPFIFVTIAASVFPDKYNSGSLNFCYPKHEVFYYFLILPISIILLVNTAIFCLVMINISSSITRGAKEKNLQLKLAFMLWFMLGLTWFLGILAEISTTFWLQIIFVYAFCILGPLQGFVVFWFTIIRDKDALAFWKNTLYSITSREIVDTSTTKDSTSMTLLSGTNTNDSK